jgi:fibronectin type 3 domain-containing protein
MRTSKYLFLVSATLLVLTGACGNDGGQSMPAVDTVPPNPPVGLQVADQTDRVLISWNDNAEVDLAGYRLYKSSDQEGPYNRVNDQVLLCPWYHDQVIPMDVTFYKVTAVDESGNESAFSEMIGIYFNTDNKTHPQQPAGQ